MNPQQFDATILDHRKISTVDWRFVCKCCGSSESSLSPLICQFWKIDKIWQNKRVWTAGTAQHVDKLPKLSPVSWGRKPKVGQDKLEANWRIGGGYDQWIGLRENLQESPICNGKIYGFRFQFSLKPIHWYEEKNSGPLKQATVSGASCFCLGACHVAVRGSASFSFTLKRHSVEDPYLNEGHSMRPPGNSDAGYIPPGLPLGGILLGDRDCFQHLSRTCSLQRCHILVISQGGQEHTTPFRIAHIHHLGVILGQTWPLLSVVSYQRGRN